MGHWTPTGVEPKDYDDDELKLHEPTMAIGYSLRRCARHVDSTSPSRSNLYLLSKPIRKPLCRISNLYLGQNRYGSRDVESAYWCRIFPIAPVLSVGVVAKFRPLPDRRGRAKRTEKILSSRTRNLWAPDARREGRILPLPTSRVVNSGSAA